MGIGHRYVVRLRVVSRRWYPDQGGTEEGAHAFSSEVGYDMVCRARGLPACHGMVEALLAQDFGVPGVHDGHGVSWCYVIDKVDYKGKVRLLDGDGKSIATGPWPPLPTSGSPEATEDSHS